jgi:hypothetical protein
MLWKFDHLQNVNHSHKSLNPFIHHDVKHTTPNLRNDEEKERVNALAIISLLFRSSTISASLGQFSLVA